VIFIKIKNRESLGEITAKCCMNLNADFYIIALNTITPTNPKTEINVSITVQERNVCFNEI
jgi:hypothetical protein